jgi:geranylgeranyl diphosphate synthase, type II
LTDHISNSFNLQQYLINKQKFVNDALTDIIRKHFTNSRLCNAMKYSLMASGKRLRPILCLAASEAISEVNHSVVSAACAIEMIHTYSLIHDDLPAMDNDSLRRGLPTCHVQFDEATAILAGDALLTIAFEILSSPETMSIDQHPKLTLQVIHILSKAIGCKGMIEGQMMDIRNEGISTGLEVLTEMHASKTGALIEASVKIGALLANATQDQIHHLSVYAKHIGLAFQVTDDILNIDGDPAVMGKASGTDQTRLKSTFPGLMGVARSKEYARDLVNNALQALAFFGNKAIPLYALASYVIERKQ